MTQEIECKVRLIDQEVDVVRQRIVSHFTPTTFRDLFKEDRYYTSQSGSNALFRVRREGTQVVVTRKRKEERGDGMELNREIEFTCPSSEHAVVNEFFLDLGYQELIRKEKRGQAWSHKGMTVELVYLDRLGWFVEMEILLPSDASRQEQIHAIGRLHDLRVDLGLDERPLESRYYIELIQEIEQRME